MYTIRYTILTQINSIEWIQITSLLYLYLFGLQLQGLLETLPKKNKQMMLVHINLFNRSNSSVLQLSLLLGLSELKLTSVEGAGTQSLVAGLHLQDSWQAMSLHSSMWKHFPLFSTLMNPVPYGGSCPRCWDLCNILFPQILLALDPHCKPISVVDHSRGAEIVRIPE